VQKKSKPAPIPFPPLGETVRCRVITAQYECELEIPVNSKTRKAESGIFNLDTLNGATIRTTI
jgi:hypothetical protein